MKRISKMHDKNLTEQPRGIHNTPPPPPQKKKKTDTSYRGLLNHLIKMIRHVALRVWLGVEIPSKHLWFIPHQIDQILKQTPFANFF